MNENNMHYAECSECGIRTKVWAAGKDDGEAYLLCQACLNFASYQLCNWEPEIVRKICPFCQEEVTVLKKYDNQPQWFCYSSDCWAELARRNWNNEPLPWPRQPKPEPSKPLVFTIGNDSVGTIEATGSFEIGRPSSHHTYGKFTFGNNE